MHENNGGNVINDNDTDWYEIPCDGNLQGRIGNGGVRVHIKAEQFYEKIPDRLLASSFKGCARKIQKLYELKQSGYWADQTLFLAIDNYLEKSLRPYEIKIKKNSWAIRPKNR